MNRKIWIACVLAGVLILFVGIGIGSRFRVADVRLPDDAGREEAGMDDPYVGEFRVARVIDGDTIEIEGGERVRYIGIDAPESVTPGKPVGCFGPEASEGNRSLVEGRTVRLEKDTTDRDRYGRLLRYVYSGDTLVNLELVSRGFAEAADYPPDSAFRDRFAVMEDEAREAGLGLWSACPEREYTR